MTRSDIFSFGAVWADAATRESWLLHLEQLVPESSMPGRTEKDAAFVYERQQCQNCFAAAKPTEPLLLCSQCRRTRYCNAECQKADWKLHKKICESDEKSRAISVETSTGSCTQEDLEEFLATHSLSINTFTMHAVGTTLAPPGCDETNSCLALELEFAPKYRDNRARRFRFRDAQVVRFEQLNHTYVERVPIAEYRGKNLATQLSEMRKMFADQAKSGLNARCFLTAVRSGNVVNIIPFKVFEPVFLKSIYAHPEPNWRFWLEWHINTGQLMAGDPALDPKPK